MIPIRDRIAANVRAQFASPGGRPAVVPAPFDQRLLPQDSVAFDIHADVTTMMIGGLASLLLQMLHPAALAGVWDHSNFRTDMAGRLRRTAAFIAVTTFGHREQAEAAIARVNRIHGAVAGTLPDGTPYRANDQGTLAFVGVTEALGFLDGFVRYRSPLLPAAMRDRYIGEMASIAERLGATGMPRTEPAARKYLAAARPMLRVDDRTREVCALILKSAPPDASMAVPHRLMMAAAIDLLPPWARAMHGLAGAGPARPLVRAGAGGMGAVLRWALSAPRPVRP